MEPSKDSRKMRRGRETSASIYDSLLSKANLRPSPKSCYVDPSAQVIGDVTLGEHSSIWMNAVVRGDVHSISIGANSNVQDCSVLHGMRYRYPVIVGDWVTIGHNATVHGCIVEDACLIGMGVVILNNARIGEGSIIAAGAVIPRKHDCVPPPVTRCGPEFQGKQA